MMRILFFLNLIFSFTLTHAKSISIVPMRDLNFSNATPGGEPEIVSPSSMGSSQFIVTGNPNKPFTITLPSAAVNMTNGYSSIPATQWTCDTPSPTKFGPSGIMTISVGATRGIVPSTATTGTYSGSHTIEVKYVSGGEEHSAMAKHNVRVSRSLQLIRLSDLIFPDCFVGEPAFSIAPRSTGAATFQVTGDPNTAYSISFPSPQPVKMVLIDGTPSGPNSEIILSAFNSIPYQTGKLNASGTDEVSVGATRSAILGNQKTGNYVGTFLVRVTYQ